MKNESKLAKEKLRKTAEGRSQVTVTRGQVMKFNKMIEYQKTFSVNNNKMFKSRKRKLYNPEEEEFEAELRADVQAAAGIAEIRCENAAKPLVNNLRAPRSTPQDINAYLASMKEKIALLRKVEMPETIIEASSKPEVPVKAQQRQEIPVKAQQRQEMDESVIYSQLKDVLKVSLESGCSKESQLAQLRTLRFQFAKSPRLTASDQYIRFNDITTIIELSIIHAESEERDEQFLNYTRAQDASKRFQESGDIYQCIKWPLETTRNIGALRELFESFESTHQQPLHINDDTTVHDSFFCSAFGAPLDALTKSSSSYSPTVSREADAEDAINIQNFERFFASLADDEDRSQTRDETRRKVYKHFDSR